MVGSRQNGPVSEVWTTPHRSTPVDAVVSLPGSKSITARALVLAALADGPSRIGRPLRARDTDLMAGGLRALGIGIVADGEDWLVTPARLSGPAEQRHRMPPARVPQQRVRDHPAHQAARQRPVQGPFRHGTRR